MSTTPVSLTSATSSSADPTTTSADSGNIANEDVFLQLLVAQLKYQDPSARRWDGIRLGARAIHRCVEHDEHVDRPRQHLATDAGNRRDAGYLDHRLHLAERDAGKQRDHKSDGQFLGRIFKEQIKWVLFLLPFQR